MNTSNQDFGTICGWWVSAHKIGGNTIILRAESKSTGAKFKIESWDIEPALNRLVKNLKIAHETEKTIDEIISTISQKNKIFTDREMGKYAIKSQKEEDLKSWGNFLDYFWGN